MLSIVMIAALVLSGLNWIVFVGITLFVDVPALKRLRVHAATPNVPRAENAIDPDKLVEETGALADAFRRAGAAPTAAAMSMACLVIAMIAAGVAKF